MTHAKLIKYYRKWRAKNKQKMEAYRLKALAKRRAAGVNPRVLLTAEQKRESNRIRCMRYRNKYREYVRKRGREYMRSYYAKKISKKIERALDQVKSKSNNSFFKALLVAEAALKREYPVGSTVYIPRFYRDKLHFNEAKVIEHKGLCMKVQSPGSPFRHWISATVLQTEEKT